MRVADVLRELGRPIAYYPFLSRYLGGVNASVLFCQIFYWQDKATSELGVHKTVDELETETGLTYEEQRAARAKLRAAGVLIETAKRIEHRTYFRIDEDALERLLSGEPPARKANKKRESTSEKSTSRNGKSPSREMGKVQFAGVEKPTPPDGETRSRGEGDSHPVNGTETTAEITSETTAAAARASDAVDNFAAAAAEDDQKAGSTPLDVEARLTDLLIELEAERGKRLVVDRSRDRLHIVTWVGRQLTEAELRVAHSRAAAARQRDRDERVANVGFVATFVDEVLAERDCGAPAAGGEAERPAQWWLSDSGIGAQGKRMRVERRGPNEPTPDYLIRVAQASGRGPWIDYVLKREQGGGRYQEVLDFFGAELLPVDHYAS